MADKIADKSDKIADKKTYIKEQVKDYVIVRPEDYDKIYPGDHVKYVNSEGDFKQGGFIWYKKTNETGTFWMIGLTKTPDMKPETFKFALYWHKIKYLWKRTDYETKLLIKSIDKKQDYISDIASFLKHKYGKEFTDYMNSRENKRKT